MSDPEKSAPADPVVMFGGSCACGRITYTSSGLPFQSVMCHCVTCRKLSGGPYQSFPHVRPKEVTFYDHKETLRYEGLPTDSIGGITFLRFSKAGERAFCANCYSPLAMRYRHDKDVVGLTLGSVDEATVKDDRVKDALKPTMHIFVSQAPWWDNVGLDGLEVHQRFSSSFEQDMKAWEGKEG